MTDNELNALVAERVMGHMTPFKGGLIPCPDGHPGCMLKHYGLFDSQGIRIPDYANDIAAAWSLIPRFLFRSREQKDDGTWRVWYQPSVGAYSEYVDADTATRALCLAALGEGKELIFRSARNTKE